MNLPAGLKVSLRSEVQLSSHCTMQVGGKAKYFAEPRTESELAEVLDFVKQEQLPFFILGKGSNVIFPDEGYAGIVISMLQFEKEKILIRSAQNQIIGGAGVHLYKLALACRDAGLGGVEFLASIPGTLGGAVRMNAGYSRYVGQKNEIGDIVQSVRFMDYQGRVTVLSKSDLEFRYRYSNLTDGIILEVTLQLWKRPKDWVEKEIRANFEYRNLKQDLTKPSSGSIFKNPPPPHPSAGTLIDRLGLKGLKVGGAMISPKHANYFINAGNATAQDLTVLIEKVQKAVFDATEIWLEPEVQIVKKP